VGEPVLSRRVGWRSIVVFTRLQRNHLVRVCEPALADPKQTQRQLQDWFLTCAVCMPFLRCGHCKKLAPDWAKLGSEYEASSSVVIGHVDCTAENAKELCEKHEIRGYPTLSYFVDGDAKGQPYNGGRDLDTLTAFVKVRSRLRFAARCVCEQCHEGAQLHS
jgi:hypothetical protein